MLGEEKTYTIPFAAINEQSIPLVGVRGGLIFATQESEVAVPPGFIITTQAFDDFLTANDLVQPIGEQLRNVDVDNFSSLQKASQEIEILFKQSVTPPSIFDSIRSAYDSLSKKVDAVVNLRPSWIPEVKQYSGGVDQKYTFTGVTDMNVLEKRIVASWQALFDPNAILERIENNYTDALSIALVVEKVVHAEVSGQASSYNPLTNNREEVELEAVFGLYKAVEDFNIVPDRYVVAKDGERIVEKHTSGQDSMTVQTINHSDNTVQETQIEISKPWQHRQKIADKTIQDLTIILKDLEKKIGKPIDISWVLETGRLFVTDIREANHVNPHGFVKLSHEVLAEKTKEEKKQEKSIEEYVDEIEQEIENIEHNPVPLKEVLFDARGIAREKTEEELQPMKESKEDHNHALSSEEIKKLEPLADAIWDIQEFSPRRKLEPTVLGLWMDVKGGKAKGVVNSNSFYGLYNFNGEDAVTAFGHKISDLNEKEQEQFVEYLAEELFESASPDPAKHIMYSISMLTSQEGVDFMGMDKSGMSIHLDDQSLLRLEMDAIKTLRNKLGYRNIAVAIRGLNQLEQLWTIRKYINAYGLRQSRSFEIYVEIDSVPLFLNARDYIKEEIDGIILHVDTIVENLLGKKVTIDDILDHESFWELVEKASKEIHKEHSNFIIASRNFKKGEDLLFKFMQYGITGVILSPEEINDLRPRISKLEIDMLE